MSLEERGCLHIYNLSVCCSESHLAELFYSFGTVIEVVIKHCQEGRQFPRYGMVTLSSILEAENGMEKLNGLMVLGRKIR